MAYDYIVIGGGSGGAAAAARLSEDPTNRVMLLEAGPPDRHPFIHIPALFSYLLENPKTTWQRVSEPVPGLGNRRMFFPSGRVLGGSSSINGMLYMRGQAQDYDDWRDQGNEGWGWDDVLPHFRAAEDNARGADAAHGSGGPIHVSDTVPADETSHLFLAAAVGQGIPEVRDLNSGDQYGIATVQGSIRNGRRVSTAIGYLKAAGRRPNLDIVTGAQVSRILFAGKRATGVEYVDSDGLTATADAGREIVLAASAIGSPQLLLQSGIGDAAELKALGIAPVHHLPGVGRNLHDHMFTHVMVRLKPQFPTLNQMLRSKPRMALEVIRYGLFRTGALGLTSAEICGFLDSTGNGGRPDIQITYRPFSFEYKRGGGFDFHPWPGGTASVCFTRPQSRGHVGLARDGDGFRPAIQPNYLDADADLAGMVRGVKILRRIVRSEPFAERFEAEVKPGDDVRSDDEIAAYVRQTAATIFHPVGTCKMGSDAMAVVDDRLRVHGLSGLRIADASIMPTVPSGNTNAPAIMVGEKCAAMMLRERN